MTEKQLKKFTIELIETKEKLNENYIRYSYYELKVKNNLSEEDYGIYVAFLLEQLIPWCSDFRIPEFANIQAIKALSTLFENSKFKMDTFLIKYFLNKRELSCKEYKKRNAELIKNLRTNLRRK